MFLTGGAKVQDSYGVVTYASMMAQIFGSCAPETVMMQEVIQHKTLAVNTRVGPSVESRNKPFNGLHVKRMEIHRSV